jgi:hypothetical protein
MADANLPDDGTSDDVDAVLGRFIDFEKELLALPRFDDRPAPEQDRLQREYREHLEKLDAARAAAADPGTAAAEREHMMAGFRQLFEAAGAGDFNAWELVVRVSEILGRWVHACRFWEEMRTNLRPPKPKLEARDYPWHPGRDRPERALARHIGGVERAVQHRAQILSDLEGLCSRAQYRDRAAFRWSTRYLKSSFPKSMPLRLHSSSLNIDRGLARALVAPRADAGCDCMRCAKSPASVKTA